MKVYIPVLSDVIQSDYYIIRDSVKIISVYYICCDTLHNNTCENLINLGAKTDFSVAISEMVI